MTRSRKKTPVCGNACAESEKRDKQKANRKFRKRTHDALAVGKEPPGSVREVSEVWTFAKDGKQMLDPAEFPGVIRK